MSATDPLLIAIYGKNSGLALTLIKENANLKQIDDTNCGTALVAACIYSMTAVALAIIAKEGVNLEEVDCNGRTPLMVAASKGLTAVVTALLEKGAKINALSNARLSALYQACFNSQPGTALQLIEAGADVNAGNSKPLSLTYIIDTPSMSEVKAALQAKVEAGGRRRNRTRSRKQRKSRKSRKSRRRTIN